MKVNRGLLDYSVNKFWHAFLNSEKSWVNKLYRWFVGNEDLIIDDYVAYLLSLEQATYRQEINFLIRLLKNSEIKISEFEARLWRNAGGDREPFKKSARLPTEPQIRDLIVTLPEVEKIYILILAASGRRSVDICRINSRNVKKINATWFATIKKDKTHNKPVTFSWEWPMELCGSDQLGRLSTEFENMLAKSVYPFDQVKVHKIRKIIPFRLHGLRHRCAIRMIREGFSVEDTMSFIGWQTVESLTTYIKISTKALKTFKSLDDCINFINS